MKTVSMSFGQSLSYRPSHPERTLMIRQRGGGVTFAEFQTAEKAAERLQRDHAKPPGKAKGYAPLHPRYL